MLNMEVWYVDAASSRRICCECVGRCCLRRPRSPGTSCLPSPWTGSSSSCPAPPASSTPPRPLLPHWSSPSCPWPARSVARSLSRGRARPGAAGPGDTLSWRVPGDGTETAACCSERSSSESLVLRDGARMWAWLLCVIQISICLCLLTYVLQGRSCHCTYWHYWSGFPLSVMLDRTWSCKASG